MIGFQGEAGAFSDQAARVFFGHGRTRGYRTFADVVQALDLGEVEYALLPIENTIYGPIAAVRSLLAGRRYLRIVDETMHTISQTLIGVPGAAIENIRYVCSHEVALGQCGNFLQRNPQLCIRAVDDTAGAVREVVQRANSVYAAIGPALAAELWNAVILERAIADRSDNRTRFVVVARRPPSVRGNGVE